MKNQEYLVEQGQSAPPVPEVQIKEEEPDIKEEPNEAEQIDEDDLFEDQREVEVKEPKKAIRKRAPKGEKGKPIK